uniref:Uncharacterized protein n=1 Tax=Myotis myotis TaxID=51298 RepID=A0A7J8AMA1_MYOMY|nr:hypothetical protein mMyoMyo1_007903 [Myotis myotis]
MKEGSLCFSNEITLQGPTERRGKKEVVFCCLPAPLPTTPGPASLPFRPSSPAVMKPWPGKHLEKASCMQRCLGPVSKSQISLRPPHSEFLKLSYWPRLHPQSGGQIESGWHQMGAVFQVCGCPRAWEPRPQSCSVGVQKEYLRASSHIRKQQQGVLHPNYCLGCTFRGKSHVIINSYSLPGRVLHLLYAFLITAVQSRPTQKRAKLPAL